MSYPSIPTRVKLDDEISLYAQTPGPNYTSPTYGPIKDWTLDNSNIKDLSNLFTDINLIDMDPSNATLTLNWNTSNITNMGGMFYNRFEFTSLTFGSNFNTSSVTAMDGMFNNCEGLESLDLSHFDTSSVIGMNNMFSYCSRLTNLELGNNFDTSSVEDMSFMFEGCISLQPLDLSHFDTSSITNMSYMFAGCKSLTELDLGSNFNTLYVNDMESMFKGCLSLPSLDLSHFDTSSITNMLEMFEGCISLQSIELTITLYDDIIDLVLDNMFTNCISLTECKLYFDFGAGIYRINGMQSMFEGCESLKTLDLQNLGNNNIIVAGLYSMFKGCKNLESLSLPNLQIDFDNDISGIDLMFFGCCKFKGETLDNWKSVKIFYNEDSSVNSYTPSDINKNVVVKLDILSMLHFTHIDPNTIPWIKNYNIEENEIKRCEKCDCPEPESEPEPEPPGPEPEPEPPEPEPEPNDVIPCYNKNTKIKCLIDDTIQSVPVQNLTTKTRVLTRNGPKLVTKLTHHVQHNNKNDPNRMFRYKNLLLSGRHRTIVDFKPDKKLNPRTYSCGYSVPCLSDPRFTEVVSDSDFDLYNFTLENTDINHRDIIEIEGVLVETTSEWYLKDK